MIDQFFVTKLETSQTFDEKGNRVVVTHLQAGPLTVKRIKTVEKDGYDALVCGVAARKQPKELKLLSPSPLQPGAQIKLSDVFSVGDLLKATGFSKGRGFSGVMKRHGFSGGPKTHGQSDRSRAPGSIGMRTTPGRVWKGKRMAGHYGVAAKSIRNLKVINFTEAGNILTISGTVPGARNSLIKLTKNA
jgi:large subunit ribosomal protein L3